jgi:hypothetical protein
VHIDFPAFMSFSSRYPICIAKRTAPGPSSHARRQFDALIKKLEAERANLALWQEELPKTLALADNEYRPLVRIFDARQKQLLLALDLACSDKTMSKKDRKRLVNLIRRMALALVSANGGDNLINDIHHKYSARNVAPETKRAEAFICQAVAGMSAIELDDDAACNGPAAFCESIAKKMAKQVQQEAQQEAINEAQQEALNEQAKLKQSIRDIFRKLVSVLHPDRESNPAEHGRKTVLMQRTNVAYAANDLFGLLALQREVTPINLAGPDDAGDDRIWQYNRILDAQMNEVRSQIHALKSAFALDMGWDFGRCRTLKAMMKGLRNDIAEMRANIKNIEANLNALVDLRQFKAWPKGAHIGQQESMQGKS